jgi:DNA adenine methylase
MYTFNILNKKGELNMNKFKPVIKWSGSKRSQAELIVNEFPSTIDTYYEPFIGGGSVLIELLNRDTKVNNYICSDINNDLISLWNEIKNNPKKVSEEYSTMWNEMNINDDRNFKREYFYKVRSRFNEEKSPYDFMFIMRTTTNGMPRYNKKGGFNNSFHITRDGIKPTTLHKIIMEWSSKLNENDVNFVCRDYLDISSNEGDVLYLDPPYAGTKGMYYGGISNNDLWEWMRVQKGEYYFSFDGISGDVDSTHNVPTDLYSEHKYLLSGNSSFKRTIGKSNDSVVYESLYLK